MFKTRAEEASAPCPFYQRECRKMKAIESWCSAMVLWFGEDPSWAVGVIQGFNSCDSVDHSGRCATVG